MVTHEACASCVMPSSPCRPGEPTFPASSRRTFTPPRRPGEGRDDVNALLRPLVCSEIDPGEPIPHAATGGSTVSCASHDEIVPGIKPTRPYMMNWTAPLSGPREP